MKRSTTLKLAAAVGIFALGSACTVTERTFSDNDYQRVSQGGSAGSAGSGGSNGGSAGSSGNAGTAGSGAAAGMGGASGEGGAGMGGASGQGGAGMAGASGQGGAGMGGASGQAGQGGAGMSGASGQGGAGMAGSSGASGMSGQGGAGMSGASGASGASGQAGAGGMAGSGGMGGGNCGVAGSGTVGGDCTTSCQCINGEMCNAIDTQGKKLKCGPPSGQGMGALGDSCMSNLQCASNLCSDSSRTCAIGCALLNDCPMGTRCSRIPQPNMFTTDICMKECTRNSDCPNNAGSTKVCARREDYVLDKPVFVCDWLGANPPSGPAPHDARVKTFGEVGNNNNDFCDTSFALVVPNMMDSFRCSRTCVSSADCGGVLPNCGSVSSANPSGNGTTTLLGCVP